MTDNVTEKSFEEALSRLEEIIERLESGDLSLEDGLKFFEEGIALARHCNAKLNEAQGKVELLLGMGDNILRTADFSPEEEE